MCVEGGFLLPDEDDYRRLRTEAHATRQAQSADLIAKAALVWLYRPNGPMVKRGMRTCLDIQLLTESRPEYHVESAASA